MTRLAKAGPFVAAAAIGSTALMPHSCDWFEQRVRPSFAILLEASRYNIKNREHTGDAQHQFK